MRGIRKRGDAEGGVIIASIFLLVVILLFVAVFKVAVKPGKEIIGAVENSDKTILLINALRTDIEDGKDIADLIVDGYENRNFDKANGVSTIGAISPFTPIDKALYTSVTASTPPIFNMIGSPTNVVTSFRRIISSIRLPSASNSALISKTP